MTIGESRAAVGRRSIDEEDDDGVVREACSLEGIVAADVGLDTETGSFNLLLIA